jgi:hypothetical protein
MAPETAPETELTLDEMLADPIVHLIMRRDGVEDAHVRALVRRVAARLRQAERRLAARPRGDRHPASAAPRRRARTAAATAG